VNVDLLTLGGSIAASVAGAGAAAWFGSAIAFRGRIRNFEDKVIELETTLEEREKATDARVKAWQDWREGLEPRLKAETAVRDTATAVWRAETAAVLTAQDNRQREHEVECRERWLTFMKEHGQLMAKVDILIQPATRRRR
jgi:hypothetical protein